MKQDGARRIATLGLAAATVALGAIGCESTPPATGPSLDAALAYYERAQYSEALDAAGRAEGRSAGEAKNEAALIAGLSAYELDRTGEAERWLRTASASEDPEISGRAYGGLGLIAISRNDHAGAVHQLDVAGRRLRGDDAARANYYAGDCYAILGRTGAAERAWRLARASAGDPALRALIETRLDTDSGYCVQVGAFADIGNAERAKERAATRTRAMGLDSPRIERTTDATGRPLYVVRVGNYPTKREADEARVRVGRGAVVIREQD